MSKLLQGDALKQLKTLKDNSIDCIVTDPPFGIGFMGKSWDKVVVSADTWKECLRVLKPGGFAFVMSAPRQDVLSHMIVNLDKAGFNTGFTSIYWTYASGFPKASNIGKMVDKRLGVERKITGKNPNYRAISGKKGYQGESNFRQTDGMETKKDKPATPQAKSLDGSYGGYQPKPAVEVILVAMKPLTEKTYVDQAMKNRKGITWLDDCRVPYESEGDKETARTGGKHIFKTDKYNPGTWGSLGDKVLSSSQGRFPANLLVSDDVLNDGKTHEVSGAAKTDRRNINNKDYSNRDNVFGGGIGKQTGMLHNDSGSFSRYFDLDKWYKKLIEENF